MNINIKTILKEELENLNSASLKLNKLYHGTNKSFNSFDLKFFNSGSSDGGWLGKGVYFTNDYGYAESYADENNGRVIEVSLNLKNPYILNDESYSRSPNKLANELKVSNSSMISNYLIKLGYDSVVLKYSDNNYDEEYFYEVCVFDLSTIKIK